jgi:hypothetical protein
MRKAKHLLTAAIVAASALMVGATPQRAAAEVTSAAEAAAVLEDGWYDIVDRDGNIVGFMEVRGGRIVGIYEVVRQVQ